MFQKSKITFSNKMDVLTVLRSPALSSFLLIYTMENYAYS